MIFNLVRCIVLLFGPIAKMLSGNAFTVQLIAEPGIGHNMTASMVKKASDWFDKFLK